MRDKKVFFSVLLLGLAMALLSGCDDGGEKREEPFQPPAPQVDIAAVEVKTYTMTTDLPGRIAPVRVAQVRARVAGIVLRRHFEEGSDVKRGEVLFQIDAAPFEAALARAEASLAKAEASLYRAQADKSRYESLVKARAVSPQKYENAVADLKIARAAKRSARAEIRTARLNLGYATVRAPISGRIGRALVTEGSLVGQGEATPLAVIQQLDPIYADFTQPVSDYLRWKSALSGSGNIEGGQVSITLEELGDTRSGHFLFSDVTVNRSTGQVTLRSKFPNPDGVLLPGMFVRVRKELGSDPKALFVPQRAVLRGSDGSARVMVVDGNGVVEARDVVMGEMVGQSWRVLEGLKPGERVVVNGAGKVQVGMRLEGNGHV